MTRAPYASPLPRPVLHVGGARSALQNWIYAKQHGGVFVLRIEDTDAGAQQARVDRGHPLRARLDRHRLGAATRAPTSSPRTPASTAPPPHGSTRRAAPTTATAPARTCRPAPARGTATTASAAYRGLGPGQGRALRFRTPDEGATVVVDLIRGEPTFENKLIEDFVIARGDGSPVFLLANVVDDMTMGITHVIRAEEHLPNTPKQQLLWDALGVEPPVWAHVPVVVNEKRQKLSKRRDKVALEAYRDEGYLAGAMRNYLMLLGWAPSGDREILAEDEMIRLFSISEGMPKKAAMMFDTRSSSG